MKISMKTVLASVAAAGAVTALSPVLASADPVDRALNRIPAGQISCQQAENYWTTESEYNSIRAQAQGVSLFHPRGDEIRSALARVEEAAERCGLKGGGQSAPTNNNQGDNNQGNHSPAPANHSPAPANRTPGTNNSAPAQDRGHVISAPVAPGTPTFDVPVGDVATLELPDLAVISRDFLDSVNLPLPNVQLPQVPTSSF